MVEGLTDTPYLGASSCTCPSRLSVCGWIITFAFCDEAPASPHLPSPPRCRVFLQRHGPLGCTQLPCVQAPLVCVCLWSKVSVSFTCRIEVPVGLGKPSPLVHPPLPPRKSGQLLLLLLYHSAQLSSPLAHRATPQSPGR